MTQAAQEGESASDSLLDVINGFWRVQVVCTAAQLQIPEILAAGRADSGAVAARAGTHQRATLRLLRAMCSLGLCTQHGADLFELTARGALLRSDVPGSLRGRALHVGGQLYRVMSDLPEVVRSGRPVPSAATGAAGFQAMAESPERLHAFQLSMAESSRRIGAAVASAYDFGVFSTVMDIGGGYGALLVALMEAYPQVQGVVFDLPQLASGTSKYLEDADLASRARFVGGDFFSSVPALADCFLLKYIVHDWDDEHAIALLRCCRSATRPGGVLLLVEQIVPEIITDSPADRDVMRADMTMLAYGGTERTAAQYGALLAQAGFSMKRIVPTRTVFSLIEAEPAG